MVKICPICSNNLKLEYLTSRILCFNKDIRYGNIVAYIDTVKTYVYRIIIYGCASNRMLFWDL